MKLRFSEPVKDHEFVKYILEKYRLKEKDGVFNDEENNIKIKLGKNKVKFRGNVPEDQEGQWIEMKNRWIKLMRQK